MAAAAVSEVGAPPASSCRSTARITTGAADTVDRVAGLRITASVGIAVSARTRPGPELIHRADLAMYRATTDGTGYAIAARP